MSGKSDTLEYNLLTHIFNGAALTNLGATGGSTLIWLGLFTADPGDAGSTANEGGYAAYTRISLDRSTGATGSKITSGSSAALASWSPNAAASFPTNSATSTGTFTYAGCYTSSNISSSGMLYFGTLTPSINFSNGVTPSITTGSSITED